MAAAGQVERSRTRKMDGLIALVAFVVFAVAWAAFAAALVWSQGSLDAVWEWLRGLPLLAQAVVGLLMLPLVAGLWVWETGWPTVARLVVIGGLALATLYTFLPRSLFGGRS
jgi:hypothetical protein